MKLVFATNNENKLKEIREILSQNIEIISLKDINCFEDIPETEPTIEENSILKAKYIKEKYGFDTFADDTGLEVSALNNAPGVHSARYAGDHKNNEDNIQLLLKNLEGKTNRSAHFKTIMALCIGDEIYSFEGRIEGEITTMKKGENGFGYDPVFQPKGYDKTFAELSSEEKNAISHRKIALTKLVDFLTKRNF